MLQTQTQTHMKVPNFMAPAHMPGLLQPWMQTEPAPPLVLGRTANEATGSAVGPTDPALRGDRQARVAVSAPWSSPLGPDLNASLTGMLDEVDYGMLMLDAQGQVVYRNHAAGLQLDAEHPLQLGPQGIRSLRPQDQAPLLEALAAARRGLRKLLQLGEGEQRVSVAVVPLAAASAGGPAATLLLLGKRRVCQQLSVLGFARLAGMTAAETRVLEALCAGVDPTDIAQRRGVKMSTVRTQINRIREKCGAASIREVVQQVAMLPPMLSALRSVPGRGPNAGPEFNANSRPSPRPSTGGAAAAVVRLAPPAFKRSPAVALAG